MNKINRKIEYALMGLKHMRHKQPGELTAVKEISQLYGCPFDVTARVMQTLAQKGLLRSEQGAHGGYQLIKDLKQISVYDLMVMILGPMGVAKCLHGNELCEIRDTCNIISPVQTLNRRLTDFYKNLSVNDLFELRRQEGAS